MAKGEAYKRWFEANRAIVNEKRNAYWRERRGYVRPTPEESRAKRVDRVRRWREAHPEETEAGNAASNANKRAKALGIAERLTGRDVLELWRGQPACIDCGEGRGVDHVVSLARGGSNTAANLANRCATCNARKENAGRLLPPDHPNFERARKVRERRHSVTTGPKAR